MANKQENSSYVVFHRAFRGYKKKEVEESIARMIQERAVAEENYQTRIDLLVRENGQAAKLLQLLQDDKDRLLADNGDCKRQLKEQGETIRALYERLDVLGTETERLQNTLAEMKKNVAQETPSAEEWKERALIAEETIRRFAENELKESQENDNSHHFHFSIGKKAHLDLILRKKENDNND